MSPVGIKCPWRKEWSLFENHHYREFKQKKGGLVFHLDPDYDFKILSIRIIVYFIFVFKTKTKNR